MRSIAISVSVCLWNFLYMLTVAVARLSSDSNAMYICISFFVDYVVFSCDILYGTWSWHRRRKRRAAANGKKNFQLIFQGMPRCLTSSYTTAENCSCCCLRFLC